MRQIIKLCWIRQFDKLSLRIWLSMGKVIYITHRYDCYNVNREHGYVLNVVWCHSNKENSITASRYCTTAHALHFTLLYTKYLSLKIHMYTPQVHEINMPYCTSFMTSEIPSSEIGLLPICNFHNEPLSAKNMHYNTCIHCEFYQPHKRSHGILKVYL